MQDTRQLVEKAVEKGNGLLRLKPAWVARDFLPPGKRLGLPEEEYDAGKRGWISERWIGSTTKADNAIGPEDEGLSYLDMEGQDITLKQAVEEAPDLIMGKEYAKSHKGLGRLAKIYDFADRIPYHIHQMQKDAAMVDRNSKDEAYYFPEDVDMGPHPETFFGVHPYIYEEKKFDILLPYLEDWDSDLILKHSRAYKNMAGEGFILPSGILHAPGTAVTIELQEDSDVFAMLQALVAGNIISKDLLYKDVRKQDREKYGEKVILDQINWKDSGDPYFYENFHLEPRLLDENTQDGGQEYWIYYGTSKFSGKKLVVKPGSEYSTVDNGVYNILVWKGKGIYGEAQVEANNFGLDEILVVHQRATKPIKVKNTGNDELVIFKFFGPDINKNLPEIKKYK
ncbi:MAG: hypothetical protein ACQEP5_02395 [Actinomycetota bacterium]